MMGGDGGGRRGTARAAPAFRRSARAPAGGRGGGDETVCVGWVGLHFCVLAHLFVYQIAVRSLRPNAHINK